MTNKRVISYDLIRVIAMLLVVFFHINGELQFRNISSPFVTTMLGRNLTMGQQGVVLFIIISGVTQCISFEKKNSIKEYYKSRWIAIFPMYYIAYIIGYLMIVLPEKSTSINFNIIWTILGLDGYVSSFGVRTFNIVGEWFIGMLILLYILFPILYRMIKMYPRISIVVLVIYFILLNIFYSFSALIEVNALARVFDFSLGIYLYLYYRNIKRYAARIAVIIWIFFLVVPIKIPIMYLIEIQGVTAYIWLSYISKFVEKIKNRSINNTKKVLCFLSKYSYGIFLIHHVIIRQAIDGYKDLKIGVSEYILWSIYILSLIILSSLVIYCAGTYIKQKS